MNNQNKKLKVLILGGSGLLGYHCVKFFKNKYVLSQKSKI